MQRGRRIWSVVLALGALAAFGAPAFAGLEFTDTATVSPASSGTVTFNGAVVAAATPVMLPQNFKGIAGPDRITISSTLAAGSGTIQTVTINFTYTGNPFPSAKYDTVAGQPPYTMVIQFGSIVVNPGSDAQLSEIRFKEPGGGFSDPFGVNLSLTSLPLDPFGRFFLFIPPPPGNGIPFADRDIVQNVQLTFVFTGGSGTRFGINAVVNPEPGTLALFGVGLLAIAGVVRVRRKRRGRVEPAA